MRKMKAMWSVALLLWGAGTVMAVPSLIENFNTDLSQWNTSTTNANAQVGLDGVGNLAFGYQTSSTTNISAMAISKQAVDVAGDQTITMTTRFSYPTSNTNDWWAKSYSKFVLTPSSSGALGNSLVFQTNMEDYNDGTWDMAFGVMNSAGSGWVKAYDDELGSWDIANGKAYELTMSIDRAGNAAALSIYNLSDSLLVGSTSFVYSGFTESAAYYASVTGEVKTTDGTKSISTGFKVDSLAVVPEPATMALLGLSSCMLFMNRRKKA